ncbi:MAG: radical SAM protein [Candidatus Shapirobacteria bacterium]|nr:radical SAM protein [Candidatus Shapirobacteria bacterium]
MEKIKRFIECLIPITVCNLRCSYCYVAQENGKTNKMPEFQYGIKTIAKALSKKRLGGCSYISICGAGETLMPFEIVGITHSLLENSHYVNLTNNGTQTERINQILDVSLEYRSRLHFAFSFHYLELKKNNLLDIFFENIKKVKAAGCSFLVQFNMCDEYVPYLDEMYDICIKEVGAPPQIAVTRDVTNLKEIKLLTALSKEEYKELGRKFDSPLFDFTLQNFMVKRQEYCYAGKWSGVLNLATGELRRCYSDPSPQNIFADTSKPIVFQAMGKSCVLAYCINSSHFMSLGVIPFKRSPTYASLRNRQSAQWYSAKMQKFLSGKLIYSNLNLSFCFDLVAQIINRIYRKKRLTGLH